MSSLNTPIGLASVSGALVESLDGEVLNELLPAAAPPAAAAPLLKLLIFSKMDNFSRTEPKLFISSDGVFALLLCVAAEHADPAPSAAPPLAQFSVDVDDVTDAESTAVTSWLLLAVLTVVVLAAGGVAVVGVWPPAAVADGAVVAIGVPGVFVLQRDDSLA